MTLSKPLTFWNGQFGHLNDDEADTTGISRLEFYNEGDGNNGGKCIVPWIIRASWWVSVCYHDLTAMCKKLAHS